MSSLRLESSSKNTVNLFLMADLIKTGDTLLGWVFCVYADHKQKLYIAD